MNHCEVFFKTRAVHRQGIAAWIGDWGLTPVRYLFNGRDIAVLSRDEVHHVASFHVKGKENRASTSHDMLWSEPKSTGRTVLAIVFLIPGLVLSLFKLISYLFADVKQRRQIILDHFSPLKAGAVEKPCKQDRINREIGTIEKPITTLVQLQEELTRSRLLPGGDRVDALIIHADGNLKIVSDPGILAINPLRLILEGAEFEPSVATQSGIDGLMADGVKRASTVEEALTVVAPRKPGAACACERSRQVFVVPVQKQDTSPASDFARFSVTIDEKERSISSQEEMLRYARELGEKATDNHMQICLTVPFYIAMRKIFLAEIRKHADVIEKRGSDNWYITPKKTEKSQDGLTIRTYTNGVIEEVSANRYASWKGSRTYRNGDVETGMSSEFNLEKGIQVKNGITTYFSPDVLLSNYEYNRHLIHTTSQGKNRLILIGDKPGSKKYSHIYIEINEDLIPATVNMLKKTMCIKEDKLREVFLSINFKAFVEYLFISHAIFELRPTALKIILKIIKEQGLQFDLCVKQPGSQKTLLQVYAEDLDTVKVLRDAGAT